MKGAKAILLTTLLTLAAVGQVVLTLLLYDRDGSTGIRNVGWFVLWISAVFGWLPMLTLKRWGGVPKGKGYIQTTKLVDRGVYAIVRHPQYLAGILVSLALPLIAQHWAVAVTGAVAAIIYYVDICEEERSSLAKFGQDYERYRNRVPRLNFLLGLARLFLSRSARDSRKSRP